MSQIIEGEPFQGKITEIKPAASIGGEGCEPVAIVEYERNSQIFEAWLPVTQNNLSQGDAVTVTPVTEQQGKGTLTTYRVDRISY